MTHNLIKTDNYLLVVDDSIQQIKKGEYFLLGGKHVNMWGGLGSKSLATISHKIIAHLPLNSSPILEGVPLLPPYSRHHEDGLEELAEISSELQEGTYATQHKVTYKHGFVDGYNKAKEKFLLELKKQILDFTHDLNKTSSQHQRFEGALFGLNRLKYYLSQYPTEFECEVYNTEELESAEIDWMIIGRPKRIITTQGIQWVGKYK